MEKCPVCGKALMPIVATAHCEAHVITGEMAKCEKNGRVRYYCIVWTKWGRNGKQ